MQNFAEERFGRRGGGRSVKVVLQSQTSRPELVSVRLVVGDARADRGLERDNQLPKPSAARRARKALTAAA